MFQNFHNRMGNDSLLQELKNAGKFARLLKNSGDQSIDWFLKKFPEFSFVGKFMIQHHILQAENDSKFFEDMFNRNQDWYWYLYNEMSKYPGADANPSLILNNRVAFITFNYDRSLENFLFTCFSNGHDFEKYNTSAFEIFNKIPIKHVYGKVAKFDWEREGEEFFIGYRGYHQNFLTLDSVKDGIHLIDDRKTKKNMEIGNLIMNAERIFFLGFSYADENLEMLEIPKLLNSKQEIYGTAFGMTENEIKKVKAKFSPYSGTDNPKIINTDCLGLLREYF